MTDHANLAAALVAALADLSVVDKGRTAKIETKGGGNYTYEYADLGDVVKLTRPVLAEHGIVVLTPIEEHGTGLKCTVVILHSSGDRLDFGPFPFPHGQTAQATGSMVTYYRRYALVAALGIAAGDDDDGAQAQPRQEHRDEPTPKARLQRGPVGGLINVELGDVAAMRPREVMEALKARGIIASGTVDELRAQLAELLASVPPQDVPAALGIEQQARAAGSDEDGNLAAPPSEPVAPISSPGADVPATAPGVDPKWLDRITHRLDQLPDEIRRSIEDLLAEVLDGRFPNELVPADVPTVNELVADGEASVKSGAGLAARAARNAGRAKQAS